MTSAPSPPTRSGARRWARVVALVATLFVTTATSGPRAADAPRLRRFALIVGNDRGGDDTRPLLYATEDARRIFEVLTQYGGVSSEDAVLLLDRRVNDLVTTLGALQTRVAEAKRRGERTALVLYFSGHAKDGALRLADTRVALDDLKGRLQRAGSDILVGIFDSCRSGAVTRTKGARHAPAFDIQSSTGSEEARGTVFLTSSSADEDAQESDDIHGSYFSHHLENGLRGVADQSNDGRVTLSEAYAYAYARTVADTAESAAGAQHPTFSYDLKGNGDLVLTEFGSRAEGLLVPAAAPAGTYYIVRGDVIAAEVVKPAGLDRRIALRPDRYWVKRRLPDRLRIGQVDIARGTVSTLDESRLRDAPFSDDPVKGAHRGPSYAVSLSGSVQSFFDQATREGLFPPTGLFGAELQLRDFFRRTWVVAADIAIGGARATLRRPGDVNLPFRFGELAVGPSLFTEWPSYDGSFAPFFGVRVAFLVMSRTFDGTDIPKQSFSTFSPGFVGGLRYRMPSGVSAVARARLNYLLYSIEENRSLGYWELAFALAYDF